jgi:hypothetical protein
MAALGDRRKMVTVEPIMCFTDRLLGLIRIVMPEWVNIGADSGGHGLLEPGKDAILGLVRELKVFTKVKLKDNLKRLLK